MMDMPTAEEALLQAEEYLDGRDLIRASQALQLAETLAADPDRCAAVRWMVAMLRGDFAAAWRESDSIRRRDRPDPHRFWKGEDVRGKRVIVRCLHGFGDAVQFLRYAPALRNMAAQVTFEVAPRFVEAARCFGGVEHVITWGDEAPRCPPTWDVQMEIMELPYFFRTDCGDLPIAERYLHLPPETVAQVAKEMGVSSLLRVGVVWSAGEWNPSRGVPFASLSPLFECADCEFWSLQGGDRPDQNHCELLREADGCRHSILTLAGVISKLDLVITADTLAAHLAGALGVPCWVMLQHAADWRWMMGKEGSPWYPSLRLFRQPSQGDWTSVVADVRRALHARSRESTERLTVS